MSTPRVASGMTDFYNQYMPRYCLQCDYVLDHLNDARQCPECGRGFDPDDARTFGALSRRQRHWRWVGRGVFGACLLLIAGQVLYMELTIGSVACGRWPVQVRFEPPTGQHVIGLSYTNAYSADEAAYLQEYAAETAPAFKIVTVEDERASIGIPFCRYRSGALGRTIKETGPRYAVVVIELDDGQRLSTVMTVPDARPLIEIQLDWQQFTPFSVGDLP